MSTNRRRIAIARAVFYTLVAGMAAYHIVEAFSQNPLTFQIESITIEKDGTHLMHCEIKNDSFFPIELEAGGGFLSLPGFDRYYHSRGTANGVCLARLTSGTVSDFLLLRAGERIRFTKPVPLRLRPDQPMPGWCDGLYFEYAWMPRILSRVGVLLSEPLRLVPSESSGPLEVFYVPRLVQIPVEFPKAVPHP